MEYRSALVLLITLCYVKAEEAFLPEYIHPCSFTDENFEKCVQVQIVESLPYFAKGIPQLSVPSLEPVNLDDILIDGNGLKLTFTNAKMHGLSKIKVTEFKIQLGHKEDKFELGLKGDLSLTAIYNADGKILILPIQGHGDALIECKNIDFTINSNLSLVKAHDGEHLKLLAPNYKYNIEKTTFDFKDLFNGNKQLAETTLQFANENWRQLMDDLAPDVVKQIVKTIVKSINKFLAKQPITRIIKNYTEKL